MRREHIIRADKSSEFPQNCVWFDTETFQDAFGDETLHSLIAAKVPNQPLDMPDKPRTVAHRLNFGYACYRRKHHDRKWTPEDWLRYETRSAFWEWTCAKVRPKTKLFLFCHNTSFDLPVLNVFRELSRFGYVLQSAIIDAPPTILRFRNGTKSIVVLDTLNFFRMSLAYLGEEIGLPKLDMPDNNDVTAEWDTYAHRDVEIIMAACIKWWDYLAEQDMGSFAMTLAGQSMRAFRHRYMKHQIFIDNNERALNLTRQGYYGGRVECFRIGSYQGEFSALDVNSMYPAVMESESFPCKLTAHTKYASVDDLHLWLRKSAVTARVTLRTDKPFAPVRAGGKLIFPVGEFDCILSTPELRYALKHAEILRVHEVAVYQQEPLFREMMLNMTTLKSEYKRAGEFVKEFLTKKLVNSFYGKWGQSGGKWLEDDNIEDLTCKSWIEIDVDTGKRIHYRQMGGLLQVKGNAEESRDSFPAIAAHVTSYARMSLWNLIDKAGTDNVFYCDTDCVVVNQSGREALMDEMDDYRLGALKVAGEYDDIAIYGNKDYRFGTKAKTKGVRKKAVWFDSHTIMQEQWSGLRGLVTSGQTDRPTTRTIVKHLKRIYDKGLVTPEGLVIPHRLHGGEFELPHPMDLLSGVDLLIE